MGMISGYLAAQDPRDKIGTIMVEYRSLRFDRREEIAGCLQAFPPNDPLVAYYALEQDPEKMTGVGKYTDRGLEGFMLLAHTGWDLFRQLIIPFQLTTDDIDFVFREALSPQRPYIVHLPPSLQASFTNYGELSDLRMTELFVLSDALPAPIINVLATRSENAQGWPRYEINSRAGGFAAAGTNWLGAKSAELYLQADTRGMQRGFDRAAILALIGEQSLIQKKIYLRMDAECQTMISAIAPIGFKAINVQTIQAGFQLRSERMEEGTRS